MDEQERDYLLENARLTEMLDEISTAPSGCCSDMTDVEKDMLIDLLFAKNNSLENKQDRFPYSKC